MKGIAGVVYPDVFQVNHLIFPMLDVIQQDHDTVRDQHTFNNIQIGSAGSMLSMNEKKTIIGGVDGIIHNIDLLRKELTKQGYNIHTDNPSEVIVHAYELWGKNFLEKVEGDFALMILDPMNRRLMIARDRIGKKPMYWFHSNKHFIFGSQLKALIATGAVPQAPAPDAIASYLYFGFLPQDLTPIKDVNKLLPGHYLQYNFNGSKTIEPFWSYSSYFENPTKKHKNTIAKILDTHLEESVETLMPKNDEKVGCFVSGGLGSAAIAYYVNRAHKGKPLDCFSVGFKGENDEDVEVAQLVSQRLGATQNTGYITPTNFLDDLVRIVWNLDEPIADPNIVSTWKLSQLASDANTKNVFSGMGSDEFLAGHNRYILDTQQVDIFSRIFHFQAPVLKQFIVPLISFLYKPWAYKVMKQMRTNPWQFEYMRQNALFNESMIAKASPLLQGLFDPEVFLHKFHHLSRVRSTVSSYLYFDVKTRLVDNYIRQVERFTSANDLIWNTPFLDRNLIEFLASLPEPEHLEENETATFLKVLMQDVYPDTIVARPKRIRSQFLWSWVDRSEMAEACELLKSGTLVETGLISVDWLKKCLSTKESRGKNFKYLWGILILEIWFQLMINRTTTVEPKNMSVLELLKG